MGEILCVPGQTFKDEWEPPYSTVTDFSLFTYDAEEGYYYAAEIDKDGRQYYNVELYFVDGVLQGYFYEDQFGGKKEAYFYYDEEIVTLPEEIIVEND